MAHFSKIPLMFVLVSLLCCFIGMKLLGHFNVFLSSSLLGSTKNLKHSLNNVL